MCTRPSPLPSPKVSPDANPPCPNVTITRFYPLLISNMLRHLFLAAAAVAVGGQPSPDCAARRPRVDLDSLDPTAGLNTCFCHPDNSSYHAAFRPTHRRSALSAYLGSFEASNPGQNQNSSKPIDLGFYEMYRHLAKPQVHG